MNQPKVELYCCDCLDILPTLAAGSVDAVITDPPFGTDTAEWDKDPDHKVWAEFQRLCPDGPIAIIGYAKQLVRWSRYLELELIGKIVWHKYNEILVSPGLTRAHQDIFIFGRSIKQIHAERVREPYSKLGHLADWFGRGGDNDRSQRLLKGRNERNPDGKRCTDVWSIAAPGAGFNAHLRQHPNEKPFDLMARLVMLLTDRENVILDCFMGSGTTGVAAMKLGRNFIGIEKEPKYFDIAKRRIDEALAQPALFQV